MWYRFKVGPQYTRCSLDKAVAYTRGGGVMGAEGARQTFLFLLSSAEGPEASLARSIGRGAPPPLLCDIPSGPPPPSPVVLSW